ncbi:phage portal protein [Alkalicoccus luteus]|uniref:Phage portal protein n=1 Tax=Alkalicoccus luteus TaxID=1237094 RepID=A0A969PPI6_9BACI|nr:phage portal protein [Alkalicoccus luteus]
MGLFSWMFGNKVDQEPGSVSSFRMITDGGGGFYKWDGKLYQSDIIRACIRPKAKAVGKLIAKHIRSNENEFKTNPDVGLRFLLEEPNPLMSGQLMQEKVTTQLELNNNAFILIKRDAQYYATELYPIPAVQVDMLEGVEDIYLRFHFHNGMKMTVPYSDVIHLRQDYNEHQLFGDSPDAALRDLMEVVSTIDQGLIQAIKQSAVIRWIMKFTSKLRPEDIQSQIDKFTQNYLDIEKTGGAVPADPSYDLQQVKPENYVPTDKNHNTNKRIMDFFGTNEKIISSDYNEDEWNAYYESVVQPVAMQLSDEFTRKLFTRRERGHGNKIIFESFALQYASMRTKMGLLQMVDRGALTPNEWRKILNLGPVEDGDKPIRRLDTAEVAGSDHISGKDGATDDGQDQETDDEG